MTYQPIRPYGAQPVGRISPLGPYFVDSTGKIVIRKSISAFTAPKRYATGRADDARRFMDWWAARGGNEIRVFSRVDWKGPPNSGVETGWDYDEAACEELLIDAAARGLRVEVVAHTGQYESFEAMDQHLQDVDALCLRHDNALLEVYNEPQQNGGNDLVEDLLARYTPRTPGWSSGVYDPTPYTSVTVIGQTTEGKPIYAPTAKARTGKSLNYHSPRDPSKWSRCTKDAYEYGTGQGPNVAFAPGYPDAVMLDEPSQVEQTLRDEGSAGWSAVDDWAAYGAGCAFFGCGGTMHGNPDFQQCVIPTDTRVLNCVDAFIAGLNDVPLQRYHGYNRTDPPSSNPGSRTYHRWGDDGREWVLMIRPYGFGPA